MSRLVSVLIPALDERAHIEACIRSVLAQDEHERLEVLVIDGQSSDGTPELARAAGATVIANPRRQISTALNLGLAAARGDVIIRFDAHAEMPTGHVRACLEALGEEAGAVKVGGWRRAHGAGPWGDAYAAAVASPLGVGNPLIWRNPGNAARRDVEHVPLGCFDAAAVRAVGGWREDLLANEDFELDVRLRRAGGRVVFDPRIWSLYRPRESLAAITRQYWRYGNWKAVVLLGSPSSLRPRQLAPPLLLAAAAGAVPRSPIARPARAVLCAYALVLGGVAATSRGGARTALVMAAMHASWGAGLLTGLVRRGRP